MHLHACSVCTGCGDTLTSRKESVEIRGRFLAIVNGLRHRCRDFVFTAKLYRHRLAEQRCTPLPPTPHPPLPPPCFPVTLCPRRLLGLFYFKLYIYIYLVLFLSFFFQEIQEMRVAIPSVCALTKYLSQRHIYPPRTGVCNRAVHV